MELSPLLRQHRSIRSYLPTPIDQALIEQVCGDAIVGASSSGNLNCVTLILTRDPERKEKLCELHYEQPMVNEAPLAITFCADWFRTREWLKARGARDNFDNLLGYHVAVIDATIVAQNVCLGFQAHGLGICYMGTTANQMPLISEFLELPETCTPVTTIVVGYPNEDPSKRDRLPLEAFLHEEKYRVPTSEELDETFREREVKAWQRYMSVPRLKALVEEHGIESVAQFYTSKIKYDPDSFREISEELREFLESKRFLP